MLSAEPRKEALKRRLGPPAIGAEYRHGAGARGRRPEARGRRPEAQARCARLLRRWGAARSFHSPGFEPRAVRPAPWGPSRWTCWSRWPPSCSSAFPASASPGWLRPVSCGWPLHHHSRPETLASGLRGCRGARGGGEKGGRRESLARPPALVGVVLQMQPRRPCPTGG